MVLRRTANGKVHFCYLNVYSYLLHSVFPEILEGSCTLQATYNYHHSYTVDSKVPCDNTVPCTLQDIGKFFRDYTTLGLHIFCHIQDQDLQLNQHDKHKTIHPEVITTYFSVSILS